MGGMHSYMPLDMQAQMFVKGYNSSSVTFLVIEKMEMVSVLVFWVYCQFSTMFQ